MSIRNGLVAALVMGIPAAAAFAAYGSTTVGG
jgi:hypothetical protein